VSRFDKYNPVSGGFRAPLNAAIVSARVGDVIGVSLNGSGRVVEGGAVAAIKGVICPTKIMAAGDIIDVMTDGEIVDCTLNDGTTALTAGTSYYSDAAANGDVTSASNAGANAYIGHTVEASRLVIRVTR
jgi:hypothetical protein